MKSQKGGLADLGALVLQAHLVAVPVLLGLIFGVFFLSLLGHLLLDGLDLGDDLVDAASDVSVASPGGGLLHSR